MEFSDWEDDEILVEAAHVQDVQERLEAVASRERWARDFLLEELWKRIKRRKDLKLWTREILLNHLNKVVLNRGLLMNFIDEVVEETENKTREERLKEAHGKRKMGVLAMGIGLQEV